MLRRVGTLKTYSSLGVFVTENRPLSSGGRMSAPGRSMTPNGAYMPPPMLTPLWQLEQPLSINNLSPSFCSPESAFASPRRFVERRIRGDQSGFEDGDRLFYVVDGDRIPLAGERRLELVLVAG